MILEHGRGLCAEQATPLFNIIATVCDDHVPVTRGHMLRTPPLVLV